MADLTDERIAELVRWAEGFGPDTVCALLELQRHRAAQRASAEVRVAVWHAVRHFTELGDVETRAIADRVAAELAPEAAIPHECLERGGECPDCSPDSV